MSLDAFGNVMQPSFYMISGNNPMYKTGFYPILYNGSFIVARPSMELFFDALQLKIRSIASLQQLLLIKTQAAKSYTDYKKKGNSFVTKVMDASDKK